MFRAVQTGHALADALDIPLIASPIIHEWGGIFNNPETDIPLPLPGANRQFFTSVSPVSYCPIGSKTKVGGRSHMKPLRFPFAVRKNLSLNY